MFPVATGSPLDESVRCADLRVVFGCVVR